MPVLTAFWSNRHYTPYISSLKPVTNEVISMTKPTCIAQSSRMQQLLSSVAVEQCIPTSHHCQHTFYHIFDYPATVTSCSKAIYNTVCQPFTIIHFHPFSKQHIPSSTTVRKVNSSALMVTWVTRWTSHLWVERSSWWPATSVKVRKATKC